MSRGRFRCCLSFNPRPRMGGDPVSFLFQSSGPGFNPRPRMGGDCFFIPSVCFPEQFQSTPPHGGRRLLVVWILVLFKVSIHAPAWGATRSSYYRPMPSSCFNPRPRMGGDRPRHPSVSANLCFNPRPRMGGDCGNRLDCRRCCCFNPRPRMGGDACSQTSTPGHT